MSLRLRPTFSPIRFHTEGRRADNRLADSLQVGQRQGSAHPGEDQPHLAAGDHSQSDCEAIDSFFRDGQRTTCLPTIALLRESLEWFLRLSTRLDALLNAMNCAGEKIRRSKLLIE